MKKKKYLAPAIEVLEVEYEGGVMSISGNAPSDMPYTPLSQTPYAGYNAGLTNDLEELVNNIFTVEQ